MSKKKISAGRSPLFIGNAWILFWQLAFCQRESDFHDFVRSHFGRTLERTEIISIVRKCALMFKDAYKTAEARNQWTAGNDYY